MICLQNPRGRIRSIHSDDTPSNTAKISIPKNEIGGSGNLFGRLREVKTRFQNSLIF